MAFNLRKLFGWSKKELPKELVVTWESFKFKGVTVVAPESFFSKLRNSDLTMHGYSFFQVTASFTGWTLVGDFTKSGIRGYFSNSHEARTDSVRIIDDYEEFFLYAIEVIETFYKENGRGVRFFGSLSVRKG